MSKQVVPFNSQFPYLKYIDYFGNLDTSSYNGLQAVLTARNYHGLTLTGGYTYSHALGESSDQGTSGGLQIPQNSYGNFRSQLYTSTAFDMRDRFTISGTYAIPGRKGFGQLLGGLVHQLRGCYSNGHALGRQRHHHRLCGHRRGQRP